MRGNSHLALRAQAAALLHELVQVLAALQDGVDGLVLRGAREGGRRQRGRKRDPGRGERREARQRSRRERARSGAEALDGPRGQGRSIAFPLARSRSSLTSTIFVSSSSCCTFMIWSACLGSWYLARLSCACGNVAPSRIPTPFAGPLALPVVIAFTRPSQLPRGTRRRKSSSVLLSRLNATREGYSESQTRTPTTPSDAGRACTCAVYAFSCTDCRCVGGVRSATVCREREGVSETAAAGCGDGRRAKRLRAGWHEL